MNEFDGEKIKGITVNYDQNNFARSVTITIPLEKNKYAKETLTPEKGVTRQFVKSCIKKRSDFIHSWDIWKETRLGPFDYKKHFWNSRNREKYLLAGGDQLTIEDRLRTRYLKLKSEGVVTKKTLKSNFGEMNMLNKYFGSMYISELTHKHIQDMVYAAKVTPKTIRLRLAHLEKIIQVAMTDGVLSINLFHGWKPEHDAANRSTYVNRAYTKEEFNLILEEAQNDVEFYPLFLFRCTMGMRPAEIYGLKWKYVDELHKQIEVKETLEEDWTFKDSPKTEAGHRKIKLNDYSLAAIQAQRLLTDSGDPEALVFQLSRAKNKLSAWAGSTFKNRYNAIMEVMEDKHSIQRIWSYGLRHSFATILWDSGQVAIEDLSILLGHADVETTKEHYIVKKAPTEGTSTSAINSLLSSKLTIIPKR